MKNPLHCQDEADFFGIIPNERLRIRIVYIPMPIWILLLISAKFCFLLNKSKRYWEKVHFIKNFLLKKDFNKKPPVFTKR